MNLDRNLKSHILETWHYIDLMTKFVAYFKSSFFFLNNLVRSIKGLGVAPAVMPSLSMVG